PTWWGLPSAAVSSAEARSTAAWATSISVFFDAMAMHSTSWRYWSGVWTSMQIASGTPYTPLFRAAFSPAEARSTAAWATSISVFFDAMAMHSTSWRYWSRVWKSM